MRKRSIRNYCKLNIIDNRHKAISYGQTLVSYTLSITMWTPPVVKITQDTKPFCSYKLTQRYNWNTSTKLSKNHWKNRSALRYLLRTSLYKYYFSLPLCAVYLFLSFQSFGINGQYRVGNCVPQRDLLHPQHSDSGWRTPRLAHADREPGTAAHWQLLNTCQDWGHTKQQSSYTFTLTVPRLARSGFLPKGKNPQQY